MTEIEAVMLANVFLASQPQSDDPRYRLELLGARRGKDGVWAVVYTIKSIKSPNDIIDGPTVVLVDPITRTARWLN